jgi:LysM repeat protein/ribosomal protein L40E
MKFPRPGQSRAEEPSAPDSAAPESQRVCPQCGATISTRAKTCMNCGADLVAIAKAEAAQAKAIAREQRTEAAQRPTRIIVFIFTIIVVALFVAIIVQSTRQSAIAALTPTLTRTPTRSVVLPTATPRASATPTGTPTPVPPLEYTVKNGDTPGRIALLYDLTVPELMSFNGKAEDDVIVVGDILKIPPPTPQPAATATVGPGTSTPAAASDFIYIVQPGDTLSGIADKNHLPMQRIADYNPEIKNIQSLQVGDQIKIPIAPTPTFTPGPGASSAAVTTPTPQVQYPPVKLLTPLDREIFIGDSEPILLQWLSSGYLLPEELYLVEVERPGARTVSFHTRATSYHLLTDQFPAPSDPNRLFKWRVMIVRQAGLGNDQQPIYRVVSPNSEASFEWLDTVPTSTPTATLLPGSRPAVQPTDTPVPPTATP